MLDTKYVSSTPYEEYPFQICVKATDLNDNNPSEFNIDFMGDAEIEINQIITHFSTDPSFIQMRIISPQLKFPYGNEPYLNVCFPFTRVNPSGMLKYKFRTYLNGKLNINIIDAATGQEPANFVGIILGGCIRRL